MHAVVVFVLVGIVGIVTAGVGVSASSVGADAAPLGDWLVRAGSTIQYRSPLFGQRADATLYNASAGSDVFFYIADAIVLEERRATLIYGVDKDARGCRLSVREFSTTSGALMRVLYQVHLDPSVPCERDTFVATAASIRSEYGVRQQWMCALESINRLFVYDPVASQVHILRLNDATPSRTEPLTALAGGYALVEPLNTATRVNESRRAAVSALALHCGGDSSRVYVAMQWANAVFELDTHAMQQSQANAVPILRRFYVPRPRWLQLAAKAKTPHLAIVSNTLPVQVWRYALLTNDAAAADDDSDGDNTARLLPTITLTPPQARRLSSVALDNTGRFVLAARAEIDTLFVQDSLLPSSTSSSSSSSALSYGQESQHYGQRGLLVGPIAATASSSSLSVASFIAGVGQWAITFTDPQYGTLLSTSAAAESDLVHASSGVLDAVMDEMIPMTATVVNNDGTETLFKPVVATLDRTGVTLHEPTLNAMLKIDHLPSPICCSQVICLDSRRQTATTPTAAATTSITTTTTAAAVSSTTTNSSHSASIAAAVGQRLYAVRQDLLLYSEAEATLYWTRIQPSTTTTATSTTFATAQPYSVASSHYHAHTFDIVAQVPMDSIGRQQQKQRQQQRQRLQKNRGLSAAIFIPTANGDNGNRTPPYELCLAYDDIVQCLNRATTASASIVFVCPSPPSSSTSSSSSVAAAASAAAINNTTTLDDEETSISLLWQPPSFLLIRCGHQASSTVLYAVDLAHNLTTVVQRVPQPIAVSELSTTPTSSVVVVDDSSLGSWQLALDGRGHVVITPRRQDVPLWLATLAYVAADDLQALLVKRTSAVTGSAAAAATPSASTTTTIALPWQRWPLGDDTTAAGIRGLSVDELLSMTNARGAPFDQLELLDATWIQARRAVDGLHVHKPHPLARGLLIGTTLACVLITLGAACFMLGLFTTEVLRRKHRQYARFESGRVDADERTGRLRRLNVAMHVLNALRTCCFYALACVPERWRFRVDARIRESMVERLRGRGEFINTDDIVPTYQERWGRPIPHGVDLDQVPLSDAERNQFAGRSADNDQSGGIVNERELDDLTASRRSSGAAAAQSLLLSPAASSSLSVEEAATQTVQTTMFSGATFLNVDLRGGSVGV